MLYKYLLNFIFFNVFLFILPFKTIASETKSEKNFFKDINLGLSHFNYNYDGIQKVKQANKAYTIINSLLLEKKFSLYNMQLTPGVFFAYGKLTKGDYILVRSYITNEHKFSYSLFNDFIKNFSTLFNIEFNSSGVKENILGGFDFLSLAFGLGMDGLSPLLFLDKEISWKFQISLLPFNFGKIGYDGSFHALSKKNLNTSSMGLDLKFRANYLRTNEGLNFGLFTQYTYFKLVDNTRDNRLKMFSFGLHVSW